MTKEIKAKKQFGQHFLVNQEVTQQIVATTLAFPTTNVLEVGPGMGVLTQHFLEDEKLNFRCIEIDTEAAEFLKKKYPNIAGKLITADFLNVNLSDVFKATYVLIGNFPYNISTQIVFRLLENRADILGMVGMFQKEVADRIIAPHGSKTYGILSVLVAAYFDGTYVAHLKQHDFSPPPKVESAVIKLVKKTDAIDFEYETLKKVVKAAFNQRRKTLRNSLNGLIDFTDESCAKYSGLRPEQLPWQDFVELSKHLK